jgi:hypothetical protein
LIPGEHYTRVLAISQALLEMLDPEEGRAIVEPLLRIMSEAVRRYLPQGRAARAAEFFSRLNGSAASRTLSRERSAALGTGSLPYAISLSHPPQRMFPRSWLRISAHRAGPWHPSGRRYRSLR